MLGLNKDSDIMRAPNTAFMKKSGFNEMFYHTHKRFDLSRKLTFRKGKNNLSNKLHSFYSMLTGKQFITDTNVDFFIQDRYYEKIFIMELLNAFYSGFSILFGVAYYEFSYESKNNEYIIYLYSLTLFSIFLIVNLFLMERMKNEYVFIEKTLNEEDGSYLTIPSKLIKLILLSVIILIHPNAFIKDITYVSYNTQVKLNITRKINDLLLIVVLLRIYWIIAFLVHCSKYMDSSTNRICRTYYFNTNLLFSIKSLIKTKPLFTIFTGFIFSVGFFAFAVRIFERGISEYTGLDYNRYWNAIWLVSITMATVGYGDFTPKTNEGRFICMIACINGVFLISLLIIAVSNFLQMNSIEINMFIISEKCKINDQLNENAKGVITEYFHFLEKNNMFKFQKSKKNSNEIEEEKIKFLKKSTIYRNEFLELNKNYLNKSKIGTSTIRRNNVAFRKILFKNARKLRDKLAKFDSSFNMTQNFSCENISFNILYNNFNCIFNDLTEELQAYKLQNSQIVKIRNQLEQICNYLEEEKYKVDSLLT